MQDLEKVTTSPEAIRELYRRKNVSLVVMGSPPINVNGYALLNSQTLARKTASDKFVLCDTKKPIHGITPKDPEQKAFVDAMLNKDILLNVALGTAGTGKTTLALAYALTKLFDENKKIYLSKPTTVIGDRDAFGPVPGGIQDKYDPYLGSYYIILKKLLGGKDAPVKRLKDKGQLEFIPIALARGCTFEAGTFILDEAQNLTWHELNSIISRMGDNTKMIILGDLTQIDIDLKPEETGLYKMLQTATYKESEITSGIELVTQYRSPITKLIADVNDEIRKQK